VRIVGVSDVSLGYGSSEIPALLNSLANYYGGETTVLEPDEVSRPPIKKAPFPGLEIKRFPSTFKTYSLPFRIEYITKAAKEINRLKPDVLVIFCTFSIPVLFKLKYRPAMVIYHCYEMVTNYGKTDIEMNRHATPLIDLITFPEENRARIETEVCGFNNLPKVIIYNCADSLPLKESNSVIPANSRNNRIVYFGTIDRRNALADYFLDNRLQGIPIDLFGRIMEPNADEVNKMVSGFRGTIKYRGFLDRELLARVIKEYAFSIVMWNPSLSNNHFYAAPSRLFTSIYAGIPPIVAPHPQCKMIVNRYQCGIVMKDWSFDSFYEALQRGMDIYGTPRYTKMVENCVKATMAEINWDTQFEKLIPYLKKVK
jgi:glycosyltransferase involved in cell wall biosynthesis